jgi:hypothetical protein
MLSGFTHCSTNLTLGQPEQLEQKCHLSLSGVLLKPHRLPAAIEFVMAFHLNQFVVQADDEPRWHPLRDEVVPFPLAI